jgi:hypothetical protein
MARGWESKQIEAQQADAARRDETAGRRTPTPAEQAVRQRRETLRLAAASTRHALTACRTDAHREILRMQLEAIEREADALPPPE